MAHLSTNQIQELKTKLLTKRQELLKEMSELKKDDPFLDPDHVTDNAAVDTDIREQVNHQTIEAEMNNMQESIDLIEAALRKMDGDSYGHCEDCHEPIPLQRLNLVPEARFCVQHSNSV